MVDRGNCTFTRKANIAQNANASAILIINNQKGKKILSIFFSFLLFFVCGVVILVVGEELLGCYV